MLRSGLSDLVACFTETKLTNLSFMWMKKSFWRRGRATSAGVLRYSEVREEAVSPTGGMKKETGPGGRVPHLKRKETEGEAA